MNEILDYWSNSVFTYGHGIVCQDCFARKYSEGGVAVQFVSTGTFVRVHSVREDDVLFCIVQDDMQIESNQLVCKMTDIIYVPESLWGPLFTIKKFERLLLVKDSTTAVNMGNISVGHMVQVLGPDNTCICLANVTFRNTIHKLGPGVFFGLQVIAPKENLQAIVKKVSIMEPGTKGFPRGCDLVITIDKIRPYTSKFNEENLQLPCSKESQKKSFSNKEDINNLNFKLTMPLNFKDKFSNNSKKSQLVNFSHSQHSVNSASLRKSSNSENAFIVGEEVIYMDESSPEKGIITWIGKIKNSPKVEVEFENGMKNWSELNDGSEDFKNKFKHSLILAPTDLIKLSDYVMCYTKEKTHHKVNNINNNSTTNNNNNNNFSSNTNNNINNINNNIDINNKLKLVTSCVSKHPNEGKYNISRITSASKHCAKYTEKKTNYSEPVFIKSNEECSQNKYLCTSEYYRSCPGFELQLQHNSKSFDSDDFSEKKISSKRSCSSLDCELEHFKNFKQQNYVSLTKGNHCQNSYDLCAQNWCTQDKTFSAGSNNSVVPPHSIKEILNKCHKQVQYRFPSSSKSMADKDSDDLYLPVPVLEFNNLARKSQRECGGNIEYVRSGEVCDALPGHLQRASPKKLVPESIKLTPSGDSYKGVLGAGNLHTLVSDFYENVEADYSTVPLKEPWDSHQAENSSSDEGSLHHYDAPKNGTFDYGAYAELTKGSVVELFYRGEAHYGVIRWIGAIPDEHDARTPRLMAGVEMEEEMEGFTDGTFNNTRYFQCNPKKALFVPLSKCRKDSRFLEETQRLNAATYYGQIDCPVVEGIIPPINRKEDIESICGKNRGIQGHHNSCYLDATLFSMFAFTSVFDSLLYRPPGKHDIPEYGEVQRVLREEIVNPLRKNLYVRADRVMKLRTLLDKLSSVSGLTSEEKDPEEFLNSLLAQILKAEPFLKLISGQEAFHHQLFVEKDDRLIFPSVQQLFEQSFVTSDIKLKQIPSCLIIQMPRFGKSFKMYSRILPPQLLDVTDVMENSPRQCTVCGKLAEYECKNCFGQQGMGSGLEGISFCKSCLETAHTHHSRTRHDYRSLTVPDEFFDLRDHCIIPRVYLELFAVVCIETSHYVAFVKCGSGSDAPWCFFDSMADRKGEQNGYNIPEMVPCPDLPYWLSEEGAKIMNEMNDDRQLPEHAKRLFSDAYMCMYQSPDLMMYR